jgi:hypothetical protein
VYALSCVEICKCARDVRGKGHPEAPWEGFDLVMDVEARVSVLDKLGYDKDAVVRVGGAAEANEEADVGVPAFFHEPPFALKVFGDVVFGGGEYLLDRDVDAKVGS